MIPCGWEGSCSSGTAMAIHHRHQWFIHLRAHSLRKGDEHHTYTPHGVWHTLRYIKFVAVSSFMWAPDYVLFLSSALHCTVFIRSYCSLFAARLSQHTSAYSLVVQYCSESSRHRYRKMKMTEIWQKLHCIKKSISNLSLCVWQLQMLTRALQTKLYRFDGDSFSCLINCGSTLILHSTYNWTVQSKPDSTVQQNKKK